MKMNLWKNQYTFEFVLNHFLIFINYQIRTKYYVDKKCHQKFKLMCTAQVLPNWFHVTGLFKTLSFQFHHVIGPSSVISWYTVYLEFKNHQWAYSLSSFIKILQIYLHIFIESILFIERDNQDFNDMN